MSIRSILLAATSAALLGSIVPAGAASFSFTGALTSDAEVQSFNFTVGTASTVTFVTYSYAGGTNAAGTVILRGGFDPILAVFSSDGTLVGQNDDGASDVPADSQTGAHFDTFLQLMLAAGDYTVTVSQYDNFANGLNSYDHAPSETTFTSAFGCSQGFFCDVTPDNRDGHWAFDILGVDTATQLPPGNTPGDTPIPGAAVLMGTVLAGGAGFGAWRRRRKA